MTFKLKSTLQPFVVIAALAGVCQLATAVQAMNVYNNSSITVYVTFSYGFFCNNTWTISPGDMDSRPNESGNLFAVGENYGCDVDVDTHGWVVATGAEETSILLTSYHQDGSVRETCNFKVQPIGP